MSKIFVDTNILVYCMDDSDKKRKARCRSLIEALAGDLYGVLSTQVLQEFYVAATKKLAADPLAVKDILHSFRRFETVVITEAGDDLKVYALIGYEFQAPASATG